MDAEAHKALLGALNARRNGQILRIELIQRDLRGLYAPGADLVGAQLSGARLQAASLAGSRMARVDLSGADLRGCDLAGVDFTDANLQGANLADALLDDVTLTNADLRGACLAGVLGDPLSMAFARMDRQTIERSEFTDEDIARFVSRGVDFHEPAESMPPSLRPSMGKRSPSLALSLRPLEVSARQQIADQDELEMPASLRAFKELSALIEDARWAQGGAIPPQEEGIEERPLSLIPPPPVAAPAQVQGFSLPQVGDEYLGVTIQRPLVGGTVTSTFVGTNAAGEQFVVRVFNPSCPGAALQLPAFQRGVRALNRVQGLEGLPVVQVVAVASDMTGYLVRFYENGCLEELMGVNLSLTGKLELFRSVCEGVSALHGQGLLLRCLKPKNILVDGLSPVISEIDSVDLPSLRQFSRELFGYGFYAAPEEILGQGTRSPTADVFALGRLLQYLLSGSEQPLFDKSIPKPLMELIRRATALEPAERYQYVDELLADLDRFALQGPSTVLQTSIRPAAVSRLAVQPLTRPQPKRREASDLRPVERSITKHSETGQDASWLPRAVERGLAIFGLVALLVLAVFGWTRPALVSALDGYAPAPALIVGLVAWFLPGYAARPALFRCATWAVAVLLLSFVDFSEVAALRWKHDVRHGSVEARGEAIFRLARVGHRDFTHLNLEGVTLATRDLGSADFSGSSLRGSDLNGAFLMEANFVGADVTETDFRGADLRGADLGSAMGLEQAFCNRYTLLPEGFRCRHGTIGRNESSVNRL